MTSQGSERWDDELSALVDQVCDAFESAWMAGQSPSVSEYLAGAVEPFRSRLRDELQMAELALRADELHANRSSQDSAAGLAHGDGNQTVAYQAPVSNEAKSWVGRRIGVYYIVAEIARGGMGVVYKATDERLNRPVAIKMILGGQFASPEAVRRFHVEAQAAAALNHSGIVPIHEVNSHDDIYYYVMGFVDGASLATRLREGPMSVRMAAEMMMTIAESVAHAHEQGILHRDLKPANILIDLENRPLITDFGLAKKSGDASDLTADGQVLGTPGYMAPEQAAGRSSEASPATDVYSLGAVLYEMVAGRPPFQAATYAEAIQRVQEEPPTAIRAINRQVPRDLETICLKCLAKSPSQRYATAREMADDLRRFLNHERIHAKPLSLSGRIANWARQSPALAATWIAMGSFYVYHLARIFVAGEISFGGRENAIITATVVTWSAGAWIFQRLLARERWQERALYAWAGMDVLLLTLFLLCFDGPKSPYVMGYLVLTAGAALRFRLPLVWLVTASSCAGYLVVLAEAVWRRPDKLPYHHTSTAMFLVGLLVTGIIQSLLLRRVHRFYVERAR